MCLGTQLGSMAGTDAASGCDSNETEKSLPCRAAESFGELAKKQSVRYSSESYGFVSSEY